MWASRESFASCTDLRLWHFDNILLGLLWDILPPWQSALGQAAHCCPGPTSCRGGMRSRQKSWSKHFSWYGQVHFQFGQVHFPIRPRPFSNLYRYILQQGQLGHALRQPVTVEECGLSENPAPMMEDWESPPRLPSWLGYSQPRGVCHFQVLPIFFLQKDFQPLQLQSFLLLLYIWKVWTAVNYEHGPYQRCSFYVCICVTGIYLWVVTYIIYLSTNVLVNVLYTYTRTLYIFMSLYMYIQMCMLCVSPEWERGNDTSGRDAQEVNCEGQRVNSTSNSPTIVHICTDAQIIFGVIVL